MQAGAEVGAVEAGGLGSPPHQITQFDPAICVLASGSLGNCTLLRVPRAGARPLHVLIDLGLSPRRTFALLAERGVGPEDLDAVVFTHLDGDHCHLGWCGRAEAAEGGEGESAFPAALPRHVEVFVHRSHAGRGYRVGLNGGRLLTFRDEPFALRDGLVIEPKLNFHDSLGAAAFRVALGEAALGFATDLGRVTTELIEHLRGVDTLAIESNYCPVLQAESDRPAFLKRRIMGGRGHLSNTESLEAVRAIGPGGHVVLLHLSRHCNRPDLARAGHDGAGYELILTSQEEPTPWVPVRATAGRARGAVRVGAGARAAVAVERQMTLF